MNIQLNTNLIGMFSGTYETQWQVEEHTDNGTEIYVTYDGKDFMQSIVKAYSLHETEILSYLHEIGAGFIKKFKVAGTYYSPREYNFSTDTIDFDLVINKQELISKVNDLIDDGIDFQTFLRDRYTSCDGFMSFTPNNQNDILDSIKNNKSDIEQSIGAVIKYLRYKDNQECDYDYYETIEYMVWEYWSGNGYCGLDYQLNCVDCWNETDYEILNDNDGLCNECKNK